MALSGSVDWTLTKSQVIKEALGLVKVYSEGEEPSAFTLARASNSLNGMVKAWQSDGLQLWMKKQYTVFLEKDKATYLLGPGGSYCTTDTDYVTTLLNGALSVLDTAVTVDSTTGMTAGDNIGIVQSDDTIHWDTIASVDTTTTLTLTTGVAGACSDDAYVRSFTNSADRPIRLLEGYLRNTNNTDTSMTKWDHKEYWMQPNKSSTGDSLNWYYDPQLTNGVLYPWQVIGSNGYIARFIGMKPFDDLDNNNDDFEFPQEAFEALIFNLARRLAVYYSVPLEKLNDIKSMAKETKKAFNDYDQEIGSIYFGASRRY